MSDVDVGIGRFGVYNFTRRREYKLLITHDLRYYFNSIVTLPNTKLLRMYNNIIQLI